MKNILHIWLIHLFRSTSSIPYSTQTESNPSTYICLRLKLIITLLFLVLFSLLSNAQCGPTVPAFNVDLTGNPNGIWQSPDIVRNGLCCGASGVTCISFTVTLDPLSAGIMFDIFSGAVPGGALFYQVNCGPPTALGTPICLSGVGPHLITFCKPGNNSNVYQITAFKAANAGTNITVNDGCIGYINAVGYLAPTVVWNSIYPGALGAYNSFLSCSVGCVDPTVTGAGAMPPYVDYQICGSPNPICSFPNVCDTIRITFQPTLFVNIIPENPTICFGQSSTTLTAVGTGGTPPYSYLWNSVNPSQSILVGNGTYTVRLQDASNCPPVYSTVTVTSYSVAISANAGPDQTVCNQIPVTTLSGSITGASGGIWSGGAGTFTPNATTLSGATYTPTVGELAAGSVNLILTSTGNGSCPSASDTVKINYVGFTGTVSITSTPVQCFGGNNGTATATIPGGTPPYSYFWNTAPAQLTPTATNLALGTYTVTITNGTGCTAINSVAITQPFPLALASSITNVTCPSGNNGSVSITPTGGIIPYTYLWQPGNQTTSSINSQLAGTYTVTVTDFNACQITSPYTITQPLPLLVPLVPTNVSCFNGSDGIANSTVSGGTSPYTYNWSSGATSPDASGLQAGSFTLSVTDNSGCPASNSISITQPTALVANTTSTNETCNYLNNGTATTVSSGGTPGYTYLWQPGAFTSAGINNLASGTYTLTTTDSNGCTATTFAIITEPAPLTINFIDQVNVSCFAGNNGVVTVSPTGGTPNYTYLWAPGGATTASKTNLTAGTYTITVTDNLGCVATNSVVITQPTLLSSITTSTNETCSYSNNGTASAVSSGGTAGYTYLWQPGLETTGSIANLTAGTYTLTLTDSKGCIETTTTVVTEPLPLAITFTAQTNVSCFGGSDGAVTASPSGGTPGYTYLWAAGGTTTATKTGLTAGTYSVTVTDNSGCVTTNSVVITQPTVLSAGITKTNETCNYLNNGTATAVPAGGTAGYTYLWQPGAQTTTTISNLSAGTYSLTVTDAKGCTANEITIITEPAPLTISFTTTNVSCFAGNDGTVTANPSGGTPNYTYLWAPGGATTASKTNLTAGTYTVTITDNLGCITINSVVITQPTLLSSGITSINETCSYSNDGTATAAPSGGTAGYTYLWQPGLETTGTISNLSTGTYTLTVTDSKGCIGTTTAVITEPAPLAISFTAQTNVSCFGGSDGAVTASPSGGTPGYTYLWAAGGTTTTTKTGLAAGAYSVTVTDNSGCVTTNSVVITQPTVLSTSISKTNETCDYLNDGTATAIPAGGTAGYTYLWLPGAQTSSAISNLSNGTYSLTVTDAKGCTANEITIITEPALLAINFTPTNVSCFAGNDGTVTANPTGGTPNYTYSWTPGGATTASISNLTSGTYTANVTDNFGCIATDQVIITQPAIVVASTTSTNEICSYSNDGTATAVPSGGTAGYTYLWQPGLETTGTISNLSTGTYTLTVTDSKGCIGTTTAVITEPVPLAISFTAQTNVSCFGGSDGAVMASPSGGTPGYTYLWAAGGTTTATKTGLTAGTYSVTVTDNSGCETTNSVVITQPTVLSASISKTNETCDYKNDGTATAIPAGGTAGYTYLWLPGAQTSSTISNLSGGTYSLTVTDAKGCTANEITIITEPALLAINFAPTNVSCFAGNDGTVTANPTGGTPNYTFSWTPGGATTASISNLTAGTYTANVTDSFGCIATDQVIITQPAIVVASTTSTNEICSYSNDGTATAVPSGGTAGYTYLWQPGLETTGTISNLSTGTYTLTVTDSKGCIGTTTAVITEPVPLAISFTAQTNVSCFGGSDGAVTASPSGGTPGYTYLWAAGGTTTATKTGLTAGTYFVTVTDNSGCVTTNSVVITQPTVLSASITKTNETCDYLNDGTATAIPSGGTAGYTYLWMPGAQTSSTISNLSAGTYSLTVTDAKGCNANEITIITEPAPIAINFIGQINVSCFAGSDGAVSATPSGGTPNYTYLWTPGALNTNSIFNLSTGTYSLTITDNKGCQLQNPVTITQPLAPLSVSATSLPSACYGGTSGSVSASATDGTGPYTYNWMPGNLSGQNIPNLIAGTYTVTASDSKGCTATNSITVTQPAQIILITSSINSDCGQPNGESSVSVSGGNAPYTYLWSPSGGTNAIADSLVSGAYQVEVTDFNGCTSIQSGNVNENTAPVATIFSVTNVLCFGGSTGSAQVGTTGGIGPFTYSWLPSGGTDSIATGLTAGTYTVTVTDSVTGCQSLATTSPDITQPPPILIAVTKTTVNCFGGNNGTASALASGGTPGCTYQWLPGGTTGNSITNLSASTYTVQATDNNSCVQTQPFTITQPTVALSASLSFTPVSCFGGANGTVSASATGGTAPYNYNWMPGNSNGPAFSNLAIGTYTVTVTDAKGCSFVNNITVTQPTIIVLTTDSINSNCSLANGQASVLASGGAGAYLYQWSPAGGTSATAAALFAGPYTVTITDGNGCISSKTVTVNDNASPVATVTATTNVSCNTGSNGTATVSVVGGAGPFTYSWLPSGGTNVTATGLIPGTYTVTVTDINLCQSVPAISPEITQPSPILITVTKSTVSCFAGSDGTSSATASGGTPGYTYQWLPSGTTGNSITNLSASTYTVQATDTNSCVQTQPFTITQPTVALSASLSFTPVSCFGGANGTVSASATGGTAPYNYNWMPGNSNGPAFSNLAIGTYTVTVTDAKGCSFVNNITVTQPTIIVLTTDSINSNCSLANGQASVLASGGAGAYLYQWSPAGGTSATATALFAGPYTVTITDGNGCISSKTVTVNDNPTPIATVTATTNVSCNTGSNGTATVSVVGGAGPFTYSWLPAGGTNGTATGLLPGTYTVTVTDINLCQSVPAISPEITQPSPILITVTKSTVSCFAGSDGTASATASGGTPGYTYQWLPGGTTGNSITNLSAITYTVQATDTNSCVQTQPFTITQPPLALSASVSFTPVSCFGGANGTVSASATGGTAPYNYNWMPGNSNGPAFSNLAIGTYTVTVTDAKGCSFVNNITVTQPTIIVLTTDSINSNCSLANGQASVLASGGTGAYLYQWSPAGGTSATATALFAGPYTVTITDGNGCISSKTVTVNDNPTPIATVTATSNVSCNTGSNGTATVSVVGGAGPFTYSWLPSGGTNITATGLVPGTYTVTVTDINSCQSVPAISPEITQPSPILITVTKSTVSCFAGSDGTASALASGGTPGYTYQWLPSGTTGNSITNLSAITYTVQATDTNSCVQTQPFTITQPPVALSASLSFTPVSCFGGANGTVSASATGGTAPYNYSWMPGNFNGQNISNLTAENYTVTISDSKGCTFTNNITVTQSTVVVLATSSINSNCSLANGQASVLASGGAGFYLYQWSPSGGTSATATALFSGSYSVTVTDANSCISTAGVTVNDNASPVATVTASTNVSCNAGSNGTATVSVAGGAGPFTYSWLPSGGTNSTATGLVPGTYTVTVTDVNLCQSVPAISPEITQPYPILITVTKSTVSCFAGSDGTASAIASGGTPGYAYQWLPGGTTGNSITNLSANTYTVQVTDNNSCVETIPFTITEPSQLTSVISASGNVNCFGQNNGTAIVVASGGTPVYLYNWFPLGGNGTTGTGLSAGTYTVQITDLNGCLDSSSTVITQPSQALSATATGAPTSCSGGSNGTASINAIGGTPTYFYQWTPAVSTSNNASGLSAGNYTVLITDSNSCQTNVSVSISGPSAISGTLALTNPSCGLSNGSVSSQLSGGTLPYTYLWSGSSATNSAINNIAPGTYSVQVTDALNCLFSLSANLVNIPSPLINISSVSNVSCYGGNDGSATINITQGTPPYVINWTPSGGNNLTASLLPIDTYRVKVVDAIGCQTIDSVIIAEPTAVDVSVSSIKNVLCYGGNTGSITVSTTGGTGPLYTYSWLPASSSTSTAAGLTEGTYTVNVTDQNNCVKAISAPITEPALLSSSIGTVINPTCYDETGSAEVLATGGVLPYTYSWSAPATGETGSTLNNLIAGSYTVTVTDTNGCISTSNVLLTQPQKLITTAGANDTICLGQSGSVSASASGGTGSYYFVWQPSGANNAGTLVISPTSNTTYTVVAYDQVGCPGTPSTVTAIVYTLNGANVQAMATSPICPGASTSVYVTTSGTTGPLTYQWNYNLGTGPGAYQTAPTQPTTYIVTVSNVCGLSVTDSVDVVFSDQPTIALSSDPSALCALGGVQFTDSSVTGNINDPITSWYWNFDDGTTSTDQNPFHYFNQSGTFYVTLTVNTNGGCTTNNATAPLTITAYPPPIAAFAVNSSDLLIPYDVLVCDNQSVGANSYEWSFGEGGTSTAVDPEYVYTLSGTFQVQLIATSQYGCLDTAYAEVITNANVIFPNVFTPDPNGSSGGTYTLFDLSNDVFFPYTYGVVEYKLEMFNRWGEQIFESLDIKTGWDGYYRGEICQQDVYVWKAFIKLNNGKIYYLSGDLLLLK